MNKEKYNLINAKFGKLHVIKREGKTKQGSVLWMCICKCGKKSLVKTSSLINGKTKSCGCLRHLDKGEANLNLLFNKCKQSALRRKIPFELSKDDFKELTSGDCHYCGSKPKHRIKYKKFYGKYLSNGIDRVVNKIGYKKINCVSSCYLCNRAKSNMKYRDFLLLVEKIAKNLKLNRPLH